VLSKPFTEGKSPMRRVFVLSFVAQKCVTEPVAIIDDSLGCRGHWPYRSFS